MEENMKIELTGVEISVYVRANEDGTVTVTLIDDIKEDMQHYLHCTNNDFGAGSFPTWIGADEDFEDWRKLNPHAKGNRS
jgi:hypothetical protein